MKKDLHHIIQDDKGGTSNAAVLSIAPQASETAINGSSADLKGYHSAEVLIVAGTRTDGTFTFTIQESSDDSAWSAVANASLLGGNNAIVVNTTATASKIYARGYNGTKRYLRVIQTETSATTGLVYSSVILRGHKQNKGQLNS